MQPGQLGVRELPDLRVHRGDDGRRDRLVLPGGIRSSLGGDDRADLGDLVRYRPVGQMRPRAATSSVYAGQPPDGGVHIGWHAQVEHEQRPAAGLCPGGAHVPGEHDGARRRR